MTTLKAVGKKEPCVKDQQDGFRRIEDVERLARLEYVVYENHDPRLEKVSQEVEVVVKNQAEINMHLKSIKKMVMAFLIGAAGTQIGWEKITSFVSLIM